MRRITSRGRRTDPEWSSTAVRLNDVNRATGRRSQATRKACRLVGWEYRLVGVPDSIVTANVRWLAGYRHPRHLLPEIAAALGDAFRSPRGLLTGAETVGDPMAVLPVLFHLLWRQELVVDLSVPLHQAAVVSPTAAT